MAQASQALTTQPGQQPATDTAGSGPRRDGQGRLGRLISEYLGDRVFRQLALVLGLAVAIAAGVGLVMWVQEPMYRPLFSDLPAEDASAVMDALQTANIPFQVDENSGAIMVPMDRIYDARMTLSAQGLPQTGGVGFESLRKDPGFGTSRFLQTARFHRALETELGRTITSLNAVRSARVHLAIPERSAFVSEDRKPTASVTVTLFPGRSLSDGQVRAVVNLVAGAVPELSAERVSVVDQDGTLLTEQSGGNGAEASGEQLAQQRRIERNYVQRIRDLLAPIVGRDKVRAQVDAQLDFSVTEQTEERYDPDQTALRSEQISNDRSVRGEGPNGVPGALTNQPPAGGQLAPVQQGQQGR
ncbi:flagellar basal-body MS-ring/collar protein FliF, partial [Arhodomonas sp. KWT]|uniref:flagellar basal-body MS-ring/collar protein FliF n=1 Tax=Arhodomonas sp. KWT TaxID=2679915 RepID=UPI0013D62E51